MQRASRTTPPGTIEHLARARRRELWLYGGTVAVLGLALYVVVRFIAAGPQTQSEECRQAYARARTAAESSIVDARIIGNARMGEQSNCGSERKLVGRRPPPT